MKKKGLMCQLIISDICDSMDSSVFLCETRHRLQPHVNADSVSYPKHHNRKWL